jgi:hypothetical protein
MPKTAQPRVILLHWKQEEILDRAARLAGLAVDPYVPVQGEGMKGLKAFDTPDAFVISLERLPSHGRDIGWHLMQQKATRQIPLVYVGGDPAKVAKIRELLPEAVYTSWDEAAEAVRMALAAPAGVPVRKPPVVSAAPLHAKIGLKAGMHIALIGAPAPLEQLVPALPEGIAIQEMPAPGETAMTLWFVRSEDEFLEEIPTIARLLGDKPRLWIFYRKGKGVTWTGMLESAGTHGLAQFKIMRLDDVWSGVAFGRARGV